MTEEQALERLRRQELPALDWLIERYNAYVASVVSAVLGPNARPEDVEELTADVFFAVWQHAPSVRPDRLRAYLGASARNRARDLLRRTRPPECELDSIELPDIAPGPEGECLRQERRQLVRRALEALPETDREIFLRSYYYLQTSQQIAEAMQLTAGAVRTRLSRGRAVLKQFLLQEASL